LAGILFFSKYPQAFYPSFIVKLVLPSGENENIQKIGGRIDEMYENTLVNVFASVKKYCKYQDKDLVLLKPVLEGLLLNAILHRDYSIELSIKIILMEDKIEIINPGRLMPTLNIEKIQNGIKIQRNPILHSIASKVIKQNERDSSIEKLLEEYPNIEFIDNPEAREFIAIVTL
jgi:predicted HTH transcriptional regulator